MEGDFSRGHRPDAKRGRDYRRVLPRQGAPILDSDLHALMDTGDRLDRQGLTHVACVRGSTDLGFLVTPGRLLAMFDPVLGQTFRTEGAATAVRDFSRKYLDRLPGLRVNGGGGTVTVILRMPLTAPTQCRIWLQADQPVTAQVAGVALNIPAGPGYSPHAITLNGAEAVLLPAAQSYSVALIETLAPSSATTAALHWAGGGFQIEGLLTRTEDTAWPGLTGPAADAFLAASAGNPGARMVAYLELSERVVTAIEDPGLREQALGTGRETTSRSAVLAQVKLAPVTDPVDADAITAGFDSIALPTGRVAFGTSAGSAAADPCDLPVPGGYSGPENRLYRLVVHEVVTAPSAVTRFKWSRDNAGDLWSCTLMPDQPPGASVTHVRIGANDALRAGDLVELTSDAIERGDSAPAAFLASGFWRPQRSQGRLFRLDGGEIVAGSLREFRLLDPITETPVAPFSPAPFGTGPKLRLWSGLLERPGTGAAVLSLEHGLIADVDGSFEPGDWWQAEARVLTPQANGPAVTTAHGPERLFAPLALLERGAPDTPLILRAWLDRRARKLCAQEADFTAYDGARVGTEADSVQEALDELFLRLSDGCGEIAVPPGVQIQAVIDTIPPGGNARICLNAGLRELTETVTIADKGDLIVGGIGPGTILRGASLRRIIRFERCRSVDLRDFAIEALSDTGGAIVDFVDCGEVRLDNVHIRSAGLILPGSSAIRQRSSVTNPTRGFTIRRCVLDLGMYDNGVTATDPGHAEIDDNRIEIRPDGFIFADRIGIDGEMSSATGELLLDRITLHDGDGGFDFVGSPVLTYNPVPGPQQVARRAIVMAGGVWTRDTVTFTTHASLDDDLWDRLSRVNPQPGGNTSRAAARSFLRGFRRNLALTLFGAPGGTTVIPAALAPRFATVIDGLGSSNTTWHGRTGIIVAMTRGPRRTLDRNQPVAELFATPGQSARIRANRITGFTQGIRVAASSRADRTNFLFADAVEIQDNRIALRLPWQARQRDGIRVGNALTVRVNGNQIIDTGYRPLSDGEPPAGFDSDGIRLWGWFGPLVEVRGNFCHGTSVGIRWRSLGRDEPSWGRPDVFIGAFADNAWSGMGLPSIPPNLP